MPQPPIWNVLLGIVLTPHGLGQVCVQGGQHTPGSKLRGEVLVQGIYHTGPHPKCCLCPYAPSPPHPYFMAKDTESERLRGSPEVT